ARFSSLDGDDDYKVDTVQQCKNEGYSVTSCSLPAYPSGQCPYNGTYFAKCVEDKVRACKEAGFTETSCPSGYITDRTCPYDSSYITCKENPCSGYSTCECGAAAGASICYSGSTAKYSACENCDPCPGYYECGGSWQYCEGSVCSADSSRCSTYCESDHFPYSCGNDYGPCYGDYRNGYCSVPCDEVQTDPCEDISGLSCAHGCSSYGSCGECNACNPAPEPEPTDPCDDVSCGSNAYCSGGSCYCNSGYEGNAYSGCTAVVTDPCADVTCGSGETCSNGSCICNGTRDCAGVCNGSAVEDCAGVCGGSAKLDCAGVCDGGHYSSSMCGCCARGETCYASGACCPPGYATYGGNPVCLPDRDLM
ncbi:MAG: hypothetical protein ACLUH4_07200, partial [Alphaproteobacteria bacterium]